MMVPLPLIIATPLPGVGSPPMPLPFPGSRFSQGLFQRLFQGFFQRLFPGLFRRLFQRLSIRRSQSHSLDKSSDASFLTFAPKVGYMLLYTVGQHGRDKGVKSPWGVFSWPSDRREEQWFATRACVF